MVQEEESVGTNICGLKHLGLEIAVISPLFKEHMAQGIDGPGAGLDADMMNGIQLPSMQN